VNEKNIRHWIVTGIILFVCCMAAGCRSQPNATKCQSQSDVAESTVIQSAENLGRLQEQNRQLAAITDDFVRGIESVEDRINIIQDGIESAQADARGTEQDIDRAIQLFIEYQSRVDKFLEDYRRLQE
jgi:hypothetical protein